MIRRIRFFNTWEPISRLWDYLLPALKNHGYDVKAVLSRGVYSEGRSSILQEFHEYVFVPRAWKAKKWAAHAFYALIVPFKILFSPRQTNLFFTQPPFFYLLAAPISWLRGNPYIIHVMDLQPELLGAIGAWDKKGWIYRLTAAWGAWALRKADRIVVIGRCMKDLMVSKGVDPARISVIKNFPSVADYPSVPKTENPFLVKNGLTDKFIVLYSGNMGIGHEFRTILETADSLRHIPDLLFLFIGKGERRTEIEAHLREHQPENIRLLGFLPNEDLPYSIGGADVHFICLRDGVEGIMVPSKMYNCMASGKPIIYEGNAAGELFREIEDQRCGQTLVHRDHEGLKKAVLTYYHDRKKAAEDGSRGQAAYRKFYTADYFQQSYLETLKYVSGF